jgi:hypothetical protein
MLAQDFEPVARHDRLVAAWQRVILAVVVIVLLGIATAWTVAAIRLGVSFETLPPYTVTALVQAVG